jgi:hexosaminidase
MLYQSFIISRHFICIHVSQNVEMSTDRNGNVMSVTTGVQGQTWSETIRTDKQYFKMAFPQVLSVAERAWHKAGWELDWQAGITYDNTTNNVDKDALLQDYGEFVTALGCKEVNKLEKLGISYCVPPPGKFQLISSVSIMS